MNQYTKEELANIHFCFGWSKGRPKKARELYRKNFPKRRLPNEETFKEAHKKLFRNVSRIRSEADSNLLVSLSPIICEERQDLCNWFNDQEGRIKGFLENILFTDQSKFKANIQNNDCSLNVWGGIHGKHLMGPFFLPLNLSGLQYKTFLNNELMPKIRNTFSREDQFCLWFMHDCAAPHKSVVDTLNESFPNRWIGKLGTVKWPSGSYDLNPMDFYVWKHIKQAINDKREIRTLDGYKVQIEEAFDAFRKDSSHFDMISELLKMRIALCSDANGGVFKGLRHLKKDCEQ